MPETPTSLNRHSGRPVRSHLLAAPGADRAGMRRLMWPFALAYTVFVIYGSLVPLDFHRYAWEEAWALFRDIRYLNLGIGSRADWVANILLFVPLAFAWLAALWHRASLFIRLAASSLVFGACMALSVGIEFAQLFFPPRTVSLNDIYAESLGAFIGIGLWWTSGGALTRWYLCWRALKGPADLAQRLLYGYLLLLFGYNLLPLDLTLSPVDIYHKWREGRIVLIPFSDAQGGFAQQLYGLLTDVLIWIPAGMLACLDIRHGKKQIWLRLTAAAAAIELLQIFVYTRITDPSDILTGSLGAAIGIWLASRWRAGGPDAGQEQAAAIGGKTVAATLFWLALVFSMFWYPFDFHGDGMFVRSRLAEAAGRVPFALYYFGTEYRAATEVLHKAGMFFPLGILLALLARRIRPGLPLLWKMAALAGVGMVAGAVELGQLFLPGKFADLTDWVLEMAGGWAGCALAWRIFPAHRATTAPAAPVPRPAPWLLAGGLVLAWALLLLAATHSPAVPYNVRELIAQEQPLLSALALACALAWIFGFPGWVAMRMATGYGQPAALPAFLLLHSVVAWLLLRVAVPIESIHDIVGAPILGWPWEWELIGRFVCLFALWSVLSFGAGFIALRPWLPGASALLWTWLAAALALLPVAYVVVIRQAATDNLAELFAGGGTPAAFLWVAAGLFMLALASAHLACAFGSGMRAGARRAALWSAASFPLSYLALNAGLEPYIIKYGQMFSAFQFLLSQDRTHYAAPMELLVRYGFAHAVLLLSMAASQAPFLGRIALTRASLKAADPQFTDKSALP